MIQELILMSYIALYKIGTGADIEKARVPGMFELQVCQYPLKQTNV